MWKSFFYFILTLKSRTYYLKKTSLHNFHCVIIERLMCLMKLTTNSGGNQIIIQQESIIVKIVSGSLFSIRNLLNDSYLGLGKMVDNLGKYALNESLAPRHQGHQKEKISVVES
jgi:hypothetical protein